MTHCDACGTPIKKGDDCGTLVSGYAKATIADVYGSDAADVGEHDDIAEFDPTGDEYMLCDTCVVRCIKMLQPSGGHSN